jgi:hypothetical protein
LTYYAVGTPEPLSKALAGVAAWGAKETGDALGQMVIQQSQNQARAILAQGLKESGLSENALKHMKAKELSAKVSDLRIGGQTLRQILKNDPESLSMLQANATDIANEIGVAALARSEGTQADVKTIRQNLATTTQAVADYQNEVTTHLKTMDSHFRGLEMATLDSDRKLKKLKTQMEGQSKAVQSLTQISYMGWSTTQKLAAVQDGLFRDLTGAQKDALLESLAADKAREDIITGIQQAAGDFGKLADIARNLKIPGDVVTGLQGVQTAAVGIALFAAGDVLGG